MRGWAWLLLLALSALGVPGEAAACAVCLGGAGDGGGSLNAGFYWSGVLLSALPFAVLAVIGGWLAYATRRRRGGVRGGEG